MSPPVAVLYSRAAVGLSAPLITIEAHISSGLPAFSIVGLPEIAVKESKERVRSAIMNSQFDWPRRRITVNLAPADLPKEGTRFDLSIALGLLLASGQLQGLDCQQYEFVGELALSGELRPIRGILPFIEQAARFKRHLIIPADNVEEACLSDYRHIYPARNLLEVCAHLLQQQPLSALACDSHRVPNSPDYGDFADVEGQIFVKRGLEIAAAGGHNVLLFGPPGTGKTLLASRLPGILPPLSPEEALTVMSVRSISGQPVNLKQWRQRPFRAPHHTASAVALVGGGSRPKPGEISLAHRGVLFLDELPEFDRKVLEVLREPMEAGVVRIARAAEQVEFPARFQLIAAMNPCPCGYLGDKQRRCECAPEQVTRYRRKISGPLLDRFDLHMEVSRHTITQQMGDKSHQIQQRVIAAHQKQLARGPSLNAALTLSDIKRCCGLGERQKQLLDKAVDKLALSKRAYHRILKVARTIADLADSAEIDNLHLSEAIGLRQLDRRSSL